MTIFDTHAHYDSRQYAEDGDAVLIDICGCSLSDRVPVGRIINSGADIKSSYTSLKLAEKYDFIYASVGVHPDSAGELIYFDNRNVTYTSEDEIPEYVPEEICLKNRELLSKLCNDQKTVAVGEIGLDYHWDIWPRDIQKQAFCWQWDLALEKNLPIIIHSRDAAEDTLKIVKEYFDKNGKNPLRADMHCYSYSIEHAEEYLKMGLMFGVGGVVTFKNAKKLKEVVDMLPMDRILLETDAPYMAPDPYRGKRNDSGKLTLVAEKIAEIKGIPISKVYDITWENALRFFNM